MRIQEKISFEKLKTETSMLVLVLLVLTGFTVWNTHILTENIRSVQAEVEAVRTLLTEDGARVDEQLATHQQDLVRLSDTLYSEQRNLARVLDVVDDIDRDISRLTGTVRTLERLSTTDSQLLQKYSRIYFLNEHYMPSELVPIDEKYDYENGKEVTVHALMWPYLERLLERAHRSGIELMVLSGYRSFAEQTTLKQDYLVRYGTGANQFSADQGFSEHQLGTAVDFTTPELGQNLLGFENTEAFRWLERNAYRYGFTMSYPKGNEYYMYEPWHWRYVGQDLALHLHRNNLHFYDLEQREIDTYLTTLFD
jgi:LAS superfamily LD-carboxypeptidase LdcB